MLWANVAHVGPAWGGMAIHGGLMLALWRAFAFTLAAVVAAIGVEIMLPEPGSPLADARFSEEGAANADVTEG
jgi:hypothetical protein